MWGVRGGTQPWRLGVTAGQLSARLPLALPSALAYECGCARGIPPPRESPPGPHLKLLETLQKPARWDHPTVPPNARSAADATDRTWGDILIEGVGEDSGESEWWVAGVGDGCVEWGVV